MLNIISVVERDDFTTYWQSTDMRRLLRHIIDLCLRSDRVRHVPTDSFPVEVLHSRDRSYVACDWLIR